MRSNDKDTRECWAKLPTTRLSCDQIHILQILSFLQIEDEQEGAFTSISITYQLPTTHLIILVSLSPNLGQVRIYEVNILL